MFEMWSVLGGGDSFYTLTTRVVKMVQEGQRPYIIETMHSFTLPM